VIVHELSTYVTLGRDTSDIARVLERTDFQSSLSPEQQRTEVLQVLLKADDQGTDRATTQDSTGHQVGTRETCER
jgi:hypothetical protein